MLKKIKKIPNKLHRFLYQYFLNALLKVFKNFSRKNFNYKLYGTNYGGMIIAEHDSLDYSTIVSAGSGEDLTFDIELINKYQCKVLLIDPTPRAIEYYRLITKHFGNSAKNNYVDSGYELPDVYDLTKVNFENLKLLEYALYHEDNLDIKFLLRQLRNMLVIVLQTSEVNILKILHIFM